MADSKLVMGFNPGSSKRHRTETSNIGLEGSWFSPGQREARIKLLDSGEVQFSKSATHETLPQGGWLSYRDDELVIIFHHNASKKFEQQRCHHLKQIFPGVYRDAYSFVCFIADEPHYQRISLQDIKKLYKLSPELERDTEIKHAYLWMHPYQQPQLLTVDHDRRIRFHRLPKQESDDQAYVSPPNGCFQLAHYSTENGISYGLCFNFHWRGDENEVSTFVAAPERIKASGVYRAMGSEKGVMTDVTDKELSRQIGSWHIICIDLLV